MNMGRRIQDVHPVREELVRPCGSSSETWWLLGCAIATLLFCFFAITSRQPTPASPTLQPWQLNAFTDLRPDELGTYNALYAAAMEIDDLHQNEDGKWLTIDSLEETFMPPFVKDAAWSRQGKLSWQRILPPLGTTDIALYLGVPAQKDISGSFLLVMQHSHDATGMHIPDKAVHPPHEIWYSRTSKVTVPSIVTDQALIAAGWKEIVPLKGGDEILRTKGENLS